MVYLHQTQDSTDSQDSSLWVCKKKKLGLLAPSGA